MSIEPPIVKQYKETIAKEIEEKVEKKNKRPLVISNSIIYALAVSGGVVGSTIHWQIIFVAIIPILAIVIEQNIQFKTAMAGMDHELKMAKISNEYIEKQSEITTVGGKDE